MSIATTKNKYSATLFVTEAPFKPQRVIDGVGATPEEAKSDCEARAAKKGWHTPRWWQIWRRKDSKEPYVQRILL